MILGSTIFMFEDRKQMLQGKDSYRGEVLWNGLPKETKMQPSITSLKNSLRVLNFDRALF